MRGFVLLYVKYSVELDSSKSCDIRMEKWRRVTPLSVCQMHCVTMYTLKHLTLSSFVVGVGSNIRSYMIQILPYYLEGGVVPPLMLCLKLCQVGIITNRLLMELMM